MSTRKKRSNAHKESLDIRQMEKLAGGPLTIAMILRSHRYCEEISQTDFAATLGISKQLLCDIEKGRRKLPPEAVADLADILDLPLSFLIKITLQEIVDNAGLDLAVEVS